MKKQKKSIRYTKVVDETFQLPVKEGNGIFKYSASVDQKGRLARYSLAYINPNLSRTDNGRVLGFDNSHGYHHRHYMGQEENVDFISYDEIEWRILHEKAKKQAKR
jgi:hypothetical protein